MYSYLQYCISLCCAAKWISHTYTYIPPFLDFLPISVTTEHWIESPVLYSRFSWVICFIHINSINSVDMSNPVSQFISPSFPYVCFLCLCLYFCFVNKVVYIFFFFQIPHVCISIQYLVFFYCFVWFLFWACLLLIVTCYMNFKANNSFKTNFSLYVAHHFECFYHATNH